MNILPKKRWHVRNRENIARVRKDESIAAEQEKEIERRRKLADQEAKIKCMQLRMKQKYGLEDQEIPRVEESTKSGHVNFFEDLESGAIVTTQKNEEHERELKEEREKYEKQIGYLTYLGQDTVEATGKVSWYNQPREQTDSDTEKDLKHKNMLDPVHKYKKFFDEHGSFSKHPSKTKQKAKKHKDPELDLSKNKSKKEQMLEMLREKRLKREKAEQERARKLLAKIRGEEPEERVVETVNFRQKYHSQFNPHLAKQNVSY